LSLSPRILGIDPGSRYTGYGLIVQAGRQLRMIEGGYLTLGDKPLPQRLGQIFTEITGLIREYNPDVMCIEQVFMARNAKSALTLGQARGAAVCAGVNSHLPVYEYSAKQIKQAVVGKGGASKAQIQYMIRLLLKLPEPPQADMADALACAICHLHTRQVESQLEANTGIS